MLDTQTHLTQVQRWSSTILAELDLMAAQVQLAQNDSSDIQPMLESAIMIHTLSGRMVKILAGLATQPKGDTITLDAWGRIEVQSKD